MRTDYYKFTISNLFIFISAIFTILLYFNDNLFSLGLHSVFFEKHMYFLVLLQFITYNFLHGGVFHFLFNSVFIYIFGNDLENYLGKKLYILFFIFSSFFIGIFYLIFSNPVEILGYSFQVNGVLIGISGFALGLLSYYTFLLWESGIEEYKGGIMAILLNIALGFMGNISFFGHFFGALSGIIFYFLTRKIIKNKRLEKL